MQNIHEGGLSTNRSRQNTNQVVSRFGLENLVLNYLGRPISGTELVSEERKGVIIEIGKKMAKHIDAK